ncbi:MAG: Jag N-terminal domain-containing protein [Sulfurovum sp.]|nr:Jag N-terminal domain-containing protein [Sulfurovum sp.]
MKKIEADTLELAYAEASKLLNCAISKLQCEVIQHPSSGILGFMKKKAIIVASCPKEKEVVKKEVVKKVEVEKEVPKNIKVPEVKEEELKVEELKVEETPKPDAVLDAFFEKEKKEEAIEESEAIEEENIIYDELALMIENQLKELLSHLCFDIDIIEVDVHDNTALIFLDGEDAALLIGKEGYRYNALSYMLFNWLYTKYELFVKLEIAEFLTKQEEMITSHLVPIIENVEKRGKGKTHFLDGILVQIALEQLRERFPNKYVAIKTSKDGKKFVVINDFNNPSKPKIEK